MVNNSLERLIDGIAHVLREDALPGIADASVRANMAGALVLLDVIKRRAAWKPELAEREQYCRVAGLRSLPALLTGTPLGQALGEPPLQPCAHEDHASFMVRMDRFVANLVEAINTGGDVPADRLPALRHWAIDYCIATVAASSEKSVTSTVGDVTRR